MNINVSSIAILISLFAALLVSVLFYLRDKSLSETASWLRYTLPTCRFFIVFIIVFLLFSPILVQTQKESKNPVFPVLIDNSKSIHLADSTFKIDIDNFVNDISGKLNRAELKILPFSNQIEIGKKFTFDQQGTNIPKVLEELNEIFPNENIGGALLISDGINTEGVQSYINDKYPIYTIGVGDSIQEADAKVKKLYCNNVVFVGNSFVTESQCQFENLKGVQQEVVLKFDGKEVQRRRYTPRSNHEFLKIKIKVNAKKDGIFPLEVNVQNKENEKFLSNNALKRFVTVKSKKLKLLLVSDEPHPDVRAIKSAFWGLDHVELFETTFSRDISLELFNAVIFVGNSSMENKSHWLDKVLFKKKGFVWFTGTQYVFNNQFFKFIRLDESNDQILMKSDPSFSLFKIDEEIKEAFENTLPISVPFGKWKFTGDVQNLMLQKINGVETDYPQIVFSNNNEIKYSVYLGAGYWRNGIKNPDAFKKLLRKTVNYVSTKSDNSQFRINVRSEFIDIEEVIISAQFYNEIGDLDNSGDVTIELIKKDSLILRSKLQRTSDKYRQNIGRLSPGVYSLKATYKKGNKEIIKKSSFFVNELTVEAEDLCMNQNFLAEISNNSGGEYFDWKNRDLTIKSLSSSKIFKTISYFELISDLLIKFKWIFFILIALVSIEWILRKWQGII